MHQTDLLYLWDRYLPLVPLPPPLTEQSSTINRSVGLKHISVKYYRLFVQASSRGFCIQEKTGDRRSRPAIVLGDYVVFCSEELAVEFVTRVWCTRSSKKRFISFHVNFTGI
jgi:hypothetical protein